MFDDVDGAPWSSPLFPSEPLPNIPVIPALHPRSARSLSQTLYDARVVSTSTRYMGLSGKTPL